MGNEAVCNVRFKGQRVQGKALLEAAEIIFRAAAPGRDKTNSVRFKIPFADLQSAKAVKDELLLQTPGGLVALELGDQAGKWCRKILHPKTRIEKLGVKADDGVSVFGHFDDAFLSELKACATNVAMDRLCRDSGCIFLAAESSKDLGRLSKLSRELLGKATLWIVYPKGVKVIMEADVIAHGRRAGLKDVKVVAFSASHTALKFVIPVSQR